MSPLPATFQDGNPLPAAQLNAILSYLTDEFQVPRGAASARPVSPTQGQLFYNTTSDLLEIYDAGWKAVGGDTGLTVGTSRSGTVSNQLTLVSAGVTMAQLTDPFGISASHLSTGLAPMFIVPKSQVPVVTVGAARDSGLPINAHGDTGDTNRGMFLAQAGGTLLHATYHNNSTIRYRLWAL